MFGLSPGLRIGLSLGMAVWLAGCDIPRDPHHTFERARGGVVRVGFTAAVVHPARSSGETSVNSLIERWHATGQG